MPNLLPSDDWFMHPCCLCDGLGCGLSNGSCAGACTSAASCVLQRDGDLEFREAGEVVVADTRREGGRGARVEVRREVAGAWV